MKVVEIIKAHSHRNILATHSSTFEITKELHLTRKGNCILAVGADKSFKDLKEEFKKVLKKAEARLTIVIEVDGEREVINALGDPKLRFNHPTDMIIRKSSYICDRTLAIKASKSAKDFAGSVRKKLQKAQKEICINLTVDVS